MGKKSGKNNVEEFWKGVSSVCSVFKKNVLSWNTKLMSSSLYKKNTTT